MSINWKPVRKGATYCSSACGGQCTRADYEKANEAGKLVLASLKNPKGWRVRVWENLGWHVSICKGEMSIHWAKYSRGVRYHVYCHSVPHDYRYFTSANKAIEQWAKGVKSHIRHCEKVVAGVVS